MAGLQLAEAPFSREPAEPLAHDQAFARLPPATLHRHGLGRPALRNRKPPLLVRANRALRTLLVAGCGLAILGYGLDVAASNELSKLQSQARRLNEQNTELSAQLLKVISFQGIQDSALGRFGLRVPEKVVIVREVRTTAPPAFKETRSYLPIMSGY